MDAAHCRPLVLPSGDAAQKIIVVQKVASAGDDFDQLLGSYYSDCLSNTDQRNRDRFGPYAEGVYDVRMVQRAPSRLVEMARERLCLKR